MHCLSDSLYKNNKLPCRIVIFFVKKIITNTLGGIFSCRRQGNTGKILEKHFPG
jgi:hypothetical protein